MRRGPLRRRSIRRSPPRLRGRTVATTATRISKSAIAQTAHDGGTDYWDVHAGSWYSTKVASSSSTKVASSSVTVKGMRTATVMAFAMRNGYGENNERVATATKNPTAATTAKRCDY